MTPETKGTTFSWITQLRPTRSSPTTNQIAPRRPSTTNDHREILHRLETTDTCRYPHRLYPVGHDHPPAISGGTQFSTPAKYISTDHHRKTSFFFFFPFQQNSFRLLSLFPGTTNLCFLLLFFPSN